MCIRDRLYEQYKEAPFEGFETEIQTINEKNELIEQLKEQIREVKGVVLCPCCNMEVAEGERFCSNCGNKMPEVLDADETDEDAIVVDAVDVTEEVAVGSAEPEQESTAEETVEAGEERLEEAAVAEEAAEAAETVERAVEAAGEVVEAAEESVEAAIETAEESAEAVVETAEEK